MTDKRTKGFTLIELMVVIGVIAILGVLVGPGIKKAYEDFKINKTLQEADTLITSLRSYYLIFNEFSGDASGGGVMPGIIPFIPSYFFKRETLENKPDYVANISPYADVALAWDFQNWITVNASTNGYIYLALGGRSSSYLQTYLNLFKNIYKNSETKILGTDVLIGFPEFPQKGKLDNISKNRYY